MLTFLAALAVCAAVAASSWPVVLQPPRRNRRGVRPPLHDPNPWPAAPPESRYCRCGAHVIGEPCYIARVERVYGGSE